MRPNKKLFLNVFNSVAAYSEPWGFVAHPIYNAQWDPSNQVYQGELIRKEVTNFIEQFSVSFSPSDRSFRFSVTQSKNSFGFASIDELPTTAAEWTESWLFLPHDEFLLMNGKAWNPFSIKNHFKIEKKNPINVDLETHRVLSAFERNAHFLFDALDHDYRGALVQVTHHEIQRPN